MKLFSVVQAFGSLCLLVTDGYPGSKDGSPEIIGPDKVQIKAQPGELLVLHCAARTNCEDDVAITYWLVNGAFPEETRNHDRIIESEELTLEEGAILQRSLLVKNVTSEDLKSTFTCVVTSAAGMAQKDIKLTTKSDCKPGKRKLRMKK